MIGRMMELVTPRTPSRAGAEGGFVLMTVLFVLLAMLVLCAPFLTTARNADRASGELADRAQVRLLLDGAARHARVRLGASHSGVPDETLLWDGLEELTVDNRFDPAFLDADDPHGAMWDLEVEDLAGRVDLNSASPQVLANLMSMTTRLSQVVAPDQLEVEVRDAGAFSGSEGFLWIRGEVIHYSQAEGRTLGGLARGIGAELNQDDEWVSSGPRPPADHPVGAHVLDQRAFAPVVWRIAGEDDVPRAFDAPEQLRETDLFALAGEIGEAGHRALTDLGTVHGGVAAGSRWQRPVRLTTRVEGGVTQDIQVDDSSTINEGSTLWIREGERGELRYVQRREGERIVLNTVLQGDYEAWEGEVLVLAKRPVNLNTAPAAVLEALFLNLQLRYQNSRITAAEARALAALVIESRPFTGFEDFLLRLVLPAAGIEPLPQDAPVVPAALAGGMAGIIGQEDALALYANGLNANSAQLVFATMPFSFRSRDVYAMELRASLNAPSGVHRTRALRERVEFVAPQRELFSMWGTQAAFDEALRLNREAPWWATGPNSTSRYAGAATPPTRLYPNWGTIDGVLYLPGMLDTAITAEDRPSSLEHVFATGEEESWAQLWASRLPEQGRFQGHTLHFDHETRDPEGRYLPDETIARLVDDDMLQWAVESEGGLLRPISFEAWIKPMVAGDGILLDVGGTSREVDRLTLALEGPDLVLRVRDGFGDHIASAGFDEATELRFDLAEGDGPGLPLDTWSHVSVDMWGTRPEQVGLLVNGSAQGVRRMGLTRLTAPALQGAGLLEVESTDGFPARGVVRLGNELVECLVSGPSTLSVEHAEQGPDAGFGGRLARTRWTVEGLPANLDRITTDHPIGTTVAVYGYSASLASGIPVGNATLADPLGPFRVARVIGVEGNPDVILAGLSYFGTGYEVGNTSGLFLALADDPEGDTDGSAVASAFNPGGGYAALIQQRWGADSTLASANPPNAPLGGVEIIRYSGIVGNVLQVAARGDVVRGELPRYAALDPAAMMGGERVFVTEWVAEAVTSDGQQVARLMDWGTYAVPISIGAPGANDLAYLAPSAEEDRSEFAQLTQLDQAELTEWVRYDTVQVTYGQLVRDHPAALLALHLVLTHAGDPNRDMTGRDPPNGPGGPGGPGSGPGPGPGFGPGFGPGNGPSPIPAPASSSPPLSPPAALGTVWDPMLGVSDLDDLPLTRAAASAFQFRGVLGTHSQTHPAGTPVLPVFHLPDRGVDGGRPGARDEVFLSGPEIDHLGWPLVVHRAHLSAEQYQVHGWMQDPSGALVALESGAPVAVDQVGFEWRDVLVALQQPSPEVIGSGGLGGQASDPRMLARITKFPSGERPRIVARAAVGSVFDGQGGEVPTAVVDELVFGAPEIFFGLDGAVPPSHTQGAGMLLEVLLDETSEEMAVLTQTLNVAGGRWGAPSGVLGELPDGGGLLRIGEEILAYSERDPSTGRLLLAPGGRGLLGTRPQPHQPTEVVTYLEHWVVTTLAAGVGPGDGTLPVASLDGFPSEGTVLVGDELVHYTRQRSGALEMPRGSSEPGTRDGEGDGLFRGRFGTDAAAHPFGTAVILFPFRYWDRWAERADAPELGYFCFQLAQPGAWWADTFWDDESAPHGQCRTGVLIRTDPALPWDADPDLTEGLTLLWEGRLDDEAVPLGVHSDRIEWRVFVSYDPGAFDPLNGLSHGWKETPRLRRLGVSYLVPGQVLRSVDR